MDENLYEITEQLYLVLKRTRHFFDLAELKYCKSDKNDALVIATFDNGFTKAVNVTADSGVALIDDVLKHLI